jgi:hypothetical protein
MKLFTKLTETKTIVLKFDKTCERSFLICQGTAKPVLRQYSQHSRNQGHGNASLPQQESLLACKMRNGLTNNIISHQITLASRAEQTAIQCNTIQNNRQLL